MADGRVQDVPRLVSAAETGRAVIPQAPGADRMRTPLEATAQFLTFAPGLYAVDFVVARSAATDSGLRLPCARLEAVPPGPNTAGRSFVSVLAEGGWLSHGEQPSFIRVVGATAGVMLTIYTIAGEIAPPEIRIRRLAPDGANLGAGGPGSAAPVPAAGAAQPDNDGKASIQLTQLAHVQGVGDVQAAAEQWAGRPGSGRQVEGFAVIPANAAMRPEEIEYQAIMGEQWNTPWVRGGAFCGSRGMGLPLLGFRIRLVGGLAESHTCSYWGSFANKGITGPVRAGAACESDGAVLEALRVMIVPRAPTTDGGDGLADAVPPDVGGAARPAAPGKSAAKGRRGARDKD